MHMAYNAFIDTSHYSLVILSIAPIRIQYLNDFPTLKLEFSIKDDEMEFLYDWLVSNALFKISSFKYSSKVLNHYSNDLYKCIYDKYSYIIENHIANQINIHNVIIPNNTHIKVLVAGDNLILARSGN